MFASTLVVNAQGAKKYVLFEHFTNASCPPCATLNPAFQTLYNQNETKAHHIAYHTSWPGFDPMYQSNTSESTSRVGYYGVSGVPDMIRSGTDLDGPSAATQADIDMITSQTSPISISVEQSKKSETEGKVDITVTTHGNVPNGNWVIRAAVVEKYLDYGSAPGSNGETDFPNIFRKMISGISGESFSAASMGENVRYSYSFDIQDDWNEEQLYVIAFVQNETTKEVINSGSSIDIPVEYATTEWTNIKQANDGGVTSFVGSMKTLFKSSNTLQFTLTTDAPADWTASMVIGEFDLPIDYAQLPFEAGMESNIGINVTPGETKGLARYELTIALEGKPLVHPMKLVYYINNGATDIVVDNSENPAWGNQYTDALATTDSEGFGRISKQAFIDGVTFQALNGIENIYFNVGWTFPALTQDFLFMLMNRLDAGVNLLIMGQDIGWEVEGTLASGEPSPYTTPISRSFYKNYLHANFVNDGNGNNSSLRPNTDDGSFAHLSNTSVVDYYGGSFFPDEIEPDASSQYATPIFYYGNSPRIAGIKAHTDKYKLVYLGVGLEMFGNDEVKNNFIKATHDWFNGVTTDIAFDEAVSKIAMTQNHPNPSNEFTQIDFANISQDAVFTLMDATGRNVMEQTIEAGSKQININTAHLQSGIYVYQLKVANTILNTKKLVIAH